MTNNDASNKARPMIMVAPNGTLIPVQSIAACATKFGQFGQLLTGDPTFFVEWQTLRGKLKAGEDQFYTGPLAGWRFHYCDDDMAQSAAILTHAGYSIADIVEECAAPTTPPNNLATKPPHNITTSQPNNPTPKPDCNQSESTVSSDWTRSDCVRKTTKPVSRTKLTSAEIEAEFEALLRGDLKIPVPGEVDDAFEALFKRPGEAQQGMPEADD